VDLGAIGLNAGAGRGSGRSGRNDHQSGRRR
jgi:hypothetical protein